MAERWAKRWLMLRLCTGLAALAALAAPGILDAGRPSPAPQRSR